MRLDIERTAPTPVTTRSRGTRSASPPRWDIVPSPRITARVAVDADVALKGSVGVVRAVADARRAVRRSRLHRRLAESVARARADRRLGGVWAPARALGEHRSRARRGRRVRDPRAATRSRSITTARLTSRTPRTSAIRRATAPSSSSSARLARAVSLTANFTQARDRQISDESTQREQAVAARAEQSLYTRADVVRAIPATLARHGSTPAIKPSSFLDASEPRRSPAAC